MSCSKDQHKCLCNVANTVLTQPTENLCPQFEPRSGRQNVQLDLDPKCLTLMVFLKDLFNVNFEKVSRRQQKHEKLPSMQIVKYGLLQL